MGAILAEGQDGEALGVGVAHIEGTATEDGMHKMLHPFGHRLFAGTERVVHDRSVGVALRW